MKKRVLLSPIDPVHDIGLKMIKRGLEEAGHDAFLLPPDLSPEEIVQEALNRNVDVVLLSRTLGYGVAELLGKLVDLAEATGLREKVKIGIGGMAIRPELAAELGFDSGFGPGTSVEEAIAFVEGREYNPQAFAVAKEKHDMTSAYDYSYKHPAIGDLLNQIVDGILNWCEGQSSPGIERAHLREEMMTLREEIESGRREARDVKNELDELQEAYASYCDDVIANFYRKGEVMSKLRRFTEEEYRAFTNFVDKSKHHLKHPPILQHVKGQPIVWAQYGTGCPFMDIAHIKVSEAWGADGVVHFDPSWAARTEGYLEGFLTHEENGSVVTPENLLEIKKALQPSTLWQVRAHRGLNVPETVVLAGLCGADLTKINIAYGSLAAGTDPERLTLDSVEALKYAAKYNLPYDMPTNEELAGVPAYKAFAGMLISTALGIRLGARPILQPLFAYSPEVMINGRMEENYVDFNAAKIYALRSIINAPIWPGAPIGFLTQTEDRVQSSVSTGLHAGLAASLRVDAISIASSDEAYSGGPIAAPSRCDTLRAVGEVFRNLGATRIQPSPQAELWSQEIVEAIERVLREVLSRPSFVQALYDGVLGSKEEGAYPGRNGKGTIFTKNNPSSINAAAQNRHKSSPEEAAPLRETVTFPRTDKQ